MRGEFTADQPKWWLPSVPASSCEQRLRELEVIYEAATIGIFLCDLDCRFISVNRHLAMEIHGLPVEQYIGKVIWDLVPNARETAEPLFRRVLDFGETILKLELEAETPKAPGVKRNWQASFYPIRDDDGAVVAISGIVDEITDRKTIEKARADVQARFKRLLDANLFGVATATVEGVIDANDAYLNIIGYSREDFLRHGIDWRSITPPEHLAKDMAGLQRLEQTGVCPAFEKEYIRKDGQRVPVLIGATALDHEPTRWVAFAIDLSAQKASEEHVRQLMHELGHRTKNLVTVISAIAHQLAKTSRSMQDFDCRFSARLQALAGINDLLIQDDWRGATVRELVISQLAHCVDLVGHRVLLDGPPVSLTASACQNIGMALHELCTNALKYGSLSSETGTVTIRWSLLPADHPENLTIVWIEEGGPVVNPPDREGFGYQVTTQFVARALDAKVSAEFRKAGLCWSLVAPAKYLLSLRPTGLQGAAGETAPGTASSLSGQNRDVIF
jgi:PAS domain S-box-containing protein